MSKRTPRRTQSPPRSTVVSLSKYDGKRRGMVNLLKEKDILKTEVWQLQERLKSQRCESERKEEEIALLLAKVNKSMKSKSL